MKKLLLISCVLISTLIIYKFAKDRWVGYERIPDNGIFDERNYALQGYSFRTTGVPMAWSDMEEYSSTPDSVKSVRLDGFSIIVNEIKPTFSNFKNFPKPIIAVYQFDFGYGLQHIRFVQPFLDHPPLGGLIYSLGVPSTAKGFLDIKPEDYRRVSLYLAIVTSVLIFSLAYQTFKNPLISLLSVIVYSSVPSYLFISRYALLENVVAPFSLLMINLLLLSINLKRKTKMSFLLLLASGFIAGLTVLVKESGVAFIAAGAIILFVNKSGWKKILYFLGIALIPILIYASWGLYFSPKLFLDTILFNSTRAFRGSLNFIYTFSSMKLNTFTLDGWWIWGFITLIFLSIFGGKKAFPITIPFLCNLATVLFLSGLNYPWYYFALIPYIALASGFALWKLIFNPDPALAISFFLFPVSSSLYWGYTVFHLPPSSLLYRVILLIFASIATARFIFRKNKLVNYIWIAALSILILVILKWNNSSILYIISKWGHLPNLSMPTI